MADLIASDDNYNFDGSMLDFFDFIQIIFGSFFFSPIPSRCHRFICLELVRESQAKIDLEIAQQFPLVADLMSISKLHEEYAEEDQVYQKKVKVIQATM